MAKKIKVSPKKYIPKTIKGSAPFMKYLMMGLLVVILVFTGIYIVNINKAITKQEGYVNAESSDDYKVVFISSNTCPYCTKFTPVFESVSKAMPNVTFKKLNNSSPEAAKYLGHISGVPHSFVIRGNIFDPIIVNQASGYMDSASFSNWVRKSLNYPSSEDM